MPAPHDLRHTAATVAIASGADIKSVQDLLGHATASFTLNVYAHTSDQMRKDTATRMQSYYDHITMKKARSILGRFCIFWLFGVNVGVLRNAAVEYNR